MDDSVGLRMNGAAKLVPFPTGDLKAFPDAVAQVDTVAAAASGSPHIAGGNNLILIDNDSTEIPAQTGAAPCSMCKRMIINAGIVRVIIRNTKDSFTSVNVDDWIYNDESLTGTRGY